MTPMRRERAGMILLATAVLAAGAAMSSCNIVAPAAYLAMGQPKAKARYVLNPELPTVVFVDDRNNAIPANSTRTRRAIADRISDDLMNRELVLNVISARDGMALAYNRDRESDLLSIGEIGRAVGAEQVIYVEMLSFRGSPDNVTPRPSAACRVKVLDVVNRERLFPPPDAEKAWQDVVVQCPPVSPELYQSNQGRREIEQMLAALLADHITKLFYDHIPDELGSRLESK